jgi:hypothetical protein
MEDLEQEKDWQLIQHCLLGNSCAWKVLIERKTAMLCAYFAFHLRPAWFDRHLMEDLTQTVWFTLVDHDCQQLRRYQPKASGFNTYLRRSCSFYAQRKAA